MKALISGVHFHNKGAEIMLYAVNQQMMNWNSENSCCLPFRIGKFQQRNQAKVSHLVWFQYAPKPYYNSMANLVASLIPVYIRQKYNMVLEPEIEIVLDASGLAFSDQWEVGITELAAENFTRWKEQGKKIILLPQAFGPFKDRQRKQAFAQIVKVADLIFARDSISYEYANQFSSSANKIKVAPDFTNLVSGVEPEYINELANRPCIIPNNRMLDKTSPEISEQYLDFLTNGINYLFYKQLNPFILIHEDFDISLAQTIQKTSKQQIDIIQEKNPLYLKGIISKCLFVVGSRFHGLVSSLSQGVPSIGTGWSHKYQMLFKDYNCSDLLIDLNKDNNLEKFDLLIEEKSRIQIAKSLDGESKKQKTRSQQMWSEVYSQIAN